MGFFDELFRSIVVRNEFEGGVAEAFEFGGIGDDVHPVLDVDVARGNDATVDGAATDTAATTGFAEIGVVAHSGDGEAVIAQSFDETATTKFSVLTVDLDLEKR